MCVLRLVVLDREGESFGDWGSLGLGEDAVLFESLFLRVFG